MPIWKAPRPSAVEIDRQQHGDEAVAEIAQAAGEVERVTGVMVPLICRPREARMPEIES